MSDATRWRPRPGQAPPPGDWRVWHIAGLEGSGCTRAALELALDVMEAAPGCVVVLARPRLVDAPLVFGRPLREAYPQRFPGYGHYAETGLVHRNGSRALHAGAERRQTFKHLRPVLLVMDDAHLWPQGAAEHLLGQIQRDARVVVTGMDADESPAGRGLQRWADAVGMGEDAVVYTRAGENPGTGTAGAEHPTSYPAHGGV